MARVKRGVMSNKRRKNVLKKAKGFRFGRSTKERMAKEAIFHGGVYAFNDRRKKKRSFRALWQIKINAAVRPLGMSYSVFINKLKKANIGLDRKVLSQLAEKNPEVFAKIINEISK